MKILITSDIHYRLKQFDWLLAHAADFDAVILAGDLLDISSTLDLTTQIVVIKKCLQKIAEQTTLLVCSGNHDGNEKNAADEYIAPWLQELRETRLAVDGDNILLGSTLFSILPWWDGDVTKVAVDQQFADASKLAFEQWIWIYHAPPDNSSTSWTGKRFIGDAALNGWIATYKPALVVCGHIHESPFKKGGSWIDRLDTTWVVNSGNNIGDVPSHIVLDLAAMQAHWTSMEGTETQALAVPLQ